MLDFFALIVYYNQAVPIGSAKRENAAIAQPVERILGKDEVASSNLASSSKTLKSIGFQGFFLFLTKSQSASLLYNYFEKGCAFIMSTERK